MHIVLCYHLMRLAGLLSDEVESLMEMYYFPGLNPMVYTRQAMKPFPAWCVGNTSRRTRLLLPYNGETDHGRVEEMRNDIIAETRDRITAPIRREGLMALSVSLSSHACWENSILTIIDSYLLACYPAIIPEDITTVEGWLLNCDFSEFTLGNVAACKKYHKDLPCSHREAGFITILDEYYLVEICVNGESWQRRCEYIISNDDGTHYDDVNRLLDMYMLARAEKMIGEI